MGYSSKTQNVMLWTLIKGRNMDIFSFIDIMLDAEREGGMFLLVSVLLVNWQQEQGEKNQEE